MKSFEVLFLGTCAHDYSPKLSTDYKDKFDKDVRRSSAVLLNRTFLVDCGDHCLDSLQIAGVDISLITDVFITHLHGDHYNVAHLRKLAEGKKCPLRIWVKENAVLPSIPNTEIRQMQMKCIYALGDGMTIMGVPANHDADVFPQHFLFERNGKRFFYGCDGAWFLTETYYVLKNANLDLLVFDGTCGTHEGEWRIGEHNTLPMLQLMLPSLKNWGTIGEKTEIYISHLAPSLHKSHEETSELLKRDGIKVAYDGLKLEI